MKISSDKDIFFNTDVILHLNNNNRYVYVYTYTAKVVISPDTLLFQYGHFQYTVDSYIFFTVCHAWSNCPCHKTIFFSYRKQ